MATVEDALRKIAKLPQNLSCADCGKEEKIFGYKNICMPFRIFVCGTCKAAHQSFSHRVKVRALCAQPVQVSASCVHSLPSQRPLSPPHSNSAVQEINQSNVTPQEVESLRPPRGSNDACRQTWLARCPANAPERPREGDPLEKYKAFVHMAYESRRWCVRFAPNGATCCCCC
jgi:hypothetical protein